MSHNHSNKNIKTAFFLNLLFTIAEVIGGFYINSVAIISDAIHDLGDTISIGMSWYLQKASNKSPDRKFTFGYRRLSLLAALINSIVLLTGSIFVIRESITRLITPETSDARGMIIFAVFGVSINGYAAWKLKSGKSMNEKVLSWHLIEDVLGWLAILIGGIVMLFWELPILDPILSLSITSFILYNALKNLRKTVLLFLQSTPSTIDTQDVSNKILAIPGIKSIHQLQIWSMDGEHNVFSAHICYVDVKSQNETILRKKIQKAINEYQFEYSTIQLEAITSDETI